MSRPNTSAISEIDTTARGPLSLLIFSAVGWLVLAGVFGLIHSLQRHSPSFMAALPYLTYGRTQAIYETTLVFGWAANAAYAVALWILARLGGGPWRGLSLLTAGTLFWNLAVTTGIVSIAMGEGTTLRFLQMPGYLHPFLLFAGAAMATPAVLAWTGRRTNGSYAAQWYAVAALFLFPWLYSAAQLMLLANPVSGVSRAVIEAWYSQNVLTLWLLPVALAAAYYLLPRLTGRPAAHYGYAQLGFWVLVVVGSWTGVRHLAGGPVPAWIPTMGIAATVLLVFHYILVGINLGGNLAGPSGAALRFVRAGLVAYLAAGLVDTLSSLRGFAVIVQFTYFETALQQLFLNGAFALIAFGALYELVPRMTGRAWPSPGQIRSHFVLAVGGMLVSVIGLALAGWIQGRGLLNPETSFAAISASTRPWLLLASVGDLALLLGGMIFAVHFTRVVVSGLLSAARRVTAAETAPAS